MERIIALAAAAAIALAATPALAKSKKHYRAYHGYYAQPLRMRERHLIRARRSSAATCPIPRSATAPASTMRAATGRCVVDLGYGRYEYCGW